MFRKKETLPPPEQTPAKPEITPKYSGETLKMIEQIDDGIEYSQNLLGGLDRLAKEKIIKDAAGLQEIYAPIEIGKLDLENYDAGAFETAGKWLRIKDAIISKLSRGLYGSEYALENEERIVDIRKLKPEAQGENYELSTEELLELQEEFGLDFTNKDDARDFLKTYVKGKGGVEKIILTRQKPEKETDKIAAEILEKRLKELETGWDAARLVGLKEDHEKFIKNKEQYEKIYDQASIYILNEEDNKRLELIDEIGKELNRNLEVIASPILERSQDLAITLRDFSILLEDLTDDERNYQNQITTLEKRISGVKDSEEFGRLLGGRIPDWEEQKAQAQANLGNPKQKNGLKQKKEALNLRITELKTSQTKVDATLDRINSIGMTKQELKEYKAEKGIKERQRLAREREMKLERERERREREREQPGRQQIIGDARQPNISGGGTGQGIAQPVRVNQPANPTENKEKIKKKVSAWLDLLDLKNITGSPKRILENNFKKQGQEFNFDTFMTLGQAKHAYTKYLVDFRGFSLKYAKEHANSIFEKISV